MITYVQRVGEYYELLCQSCYKPCGLVDSACLHWLQRTGEETYCFECDIEADCVSHILLPDPDSVMVLAGDGPLVAYDMDNAYSTACPVPHISTTLPKVAGQG